MASRRQQSLPVQRVRPLPVHERNQSAAGARPAAQTAAHWKQWRELSFKKKIKFEDLRN